MIFLKERTGKLGATCRRIWDSDTALEAIAVRTTVRDRTEKKCKLMQKGKTL